MTSIHNWAAFQYDAGDNPDENKAIITDLTQSPEAHSSGVWCFPECALYRKRDKGPLHSELLTGDSVTWFQNLATTHKKWLIVGSFFEQIETQKKLHNTCVVINPKGEIEQTYQKCHLFQCQLPNVNINESDQFDAGTEAKIVQIGPYKVGLSICFDVRFPKLYDVYAKQGCHVICIPSSFTTPTGKRHWHVLCRARAIETQCYVVAPNQCGIGANQVPTYGHSLMIDPLGAVISEGDSHSAQVIQATLNPNTVLSLREQLPVLHSQNRHIN